MNSRLYPLLGIIAFFAILFFSLFSFTPYFQDILFYLWPVALVLFAIVKVFDLFMTPLVIYNFMVGLFGMRVHDIKSSYAQTYHHATFALIICAHNEEAIIKNTLYEMEKIKYPPEKLTFIVVCDNCTDNTYKIVKKVKSKWQKHASPSLTPRRGYVFPLHVIARNDTSKKGKPYAVQYALDYIKDNAIAYDAISIADADNIYHPDFFNEMNKKLHEGKHIIQGYLGVKNPYDTFITSSSMLSYSASSRFFFTARENLGMSCALGGTGFVLSRHALETIPWSMTSLVEDLEYSVHAVIKGMIVNYAYHAKTYDEKPLSLDASVKQRKRWMQGHWYVCITLITPLLRALIASIPKIRTRSDANLFLTRVDFILYLLSPGRVLIQGWLMFSFLLLFPFSLVLPEYSGYFALDSVFKVALLVLPLIQNYYFAVIEGFKKEKLLDILYYYFIFSISYIPLTLHALFHWKEQSTWVKTVHTQQARIVDLQ